METLKNKSSGTGKLNSLEIEKYILERTSEFKVPEGRSAGDALALLKAKIAENGGSTLRLKKTGKTRMIYLVSSVAAGLLLLWGIWQILLNPPEDKIITGKGSHKEYQFPDGSKVTLNADSKISWSGKKFTNDRHINLDGEAFFNVTRGSAFTISTGTGMIKVLGTSFNVYTRENSFKVSCFTGKIMVSAGGKTVTITPGESAELSGSDLNYYPDENLEKTTGWINGEFYYENTSLKIVFAEIERQFNVKFATRDFEPGFFTGSFTNKDLRSALDIICAPMGLNYEIGRNKKIFITEIKQ